MDPRLLKASLLILIATSFLCSAQETQEYMKREHSLIKPYQGEFIRIAEFLLEL